MPSIAVLLTCFNRRELTLRCLGLLASQQTQRPRTLHVILVDDGSTDGTSDAVRKQFPDVQVLAGTGQLYWVGGMRLAFSEALKGAFDFVLFLNDDTTLTPSAIDVLLETACALEAKGITAIIAGSTCDAATGKRTYGGELQVKSWLARASRSLPLDPLPDQSLPCETMNANCTLIPRRIFCALGNFDAAFTHRFADTDYGFRALKAGFSVYIAPGYIGTCSDNSRTGTWRDHSVSLRRRWQSLRSMKSGAPFREWFIYCRRHLGPLWPIYVVSPYIKTLGSSIFSSR
jgi:GT2 family glycosyltransferase